MPLHLSKRGKAAALLLSIVLVAAATHGLSRFGATEGALLAALVPQPSTARAGPPRAASPRLDAALAETAVLAGTVNAPVWLLPSAAAATLTIPASLMLALRGAGQGSAGQVRWPDEAPSTSESFLQSHPDAFYVDEAAGKGRGLFAVAHVPRGTYLFDYTGEVLTKADYDARYPSSVSDYTAGVRNAEGEMMFIDGRDEVLGAPSRFMNGSRKPNVGRRSHASPGDPHPRILMYALRDIEPGDELEWNYGEGYWQGQASQGVTEVMTAVRGAADVQRTVIGGALEQERRAKRAAELRWQRAQRRAARNKD